MRYPLRTLLIVLGIGPPLAAVAWMLVWGEPVHPLLLAVAVYLGLVVMLLAVSWLWESVEKSGRNASLPGPGCCSYCGEKKRPLAEGMASVLICRECAAACVALIDQQDHPPGDSGKPAVKAH